MHQDAQHPKGSRYQESGNDGIIRQDNGSSEVSFAEDIPAPQEHEKRKDENSVADGGFDEEVGNDRSHQAEPVARDVGLGPRSGIAGKDFEKVRHVDVGCPFISRVVRNKRDEDKESRNHHEDSHDGPPPPGSSGSPAFCVCGIVAGAHRLTHQAVAVRSGAVFFSVSRFNFSTLPSIWGRTGIESISAQIFRSSPIPIS